MTSGKPEDDGKPDDATLPGPPGISRRTFIKSWGAGSVAFAVSPVAMAAGEEPDTIRAGDEATRVRLEVNGKSRELLVEPRWSLLYVLRERLGLTAAKAGCERGECGACTVLIDDVPRYACLTLALEVEGRRVETAEGLMNGKQLGPVQQSFVHEDGLQCGYCTPGTIMAAAGRLRKSADPSLDEMRTGMSGKLCRCGAYAHIFNAVGDAAKRRKM